MNHPSPPCPDPLCLRTFNNPQVCQKCPVQPAPALTPVEPAPLIREGRGGRRAGAGAPKGNLNHLKDGNRSNLIRKAVDKLAEDPELRVLFLVLARATVDGEIPRTTRKLIHKAIERGGQHAEAL